jgi:hypothetical protein
VDTARHVERSFGELLLRNLPPMSPGAGTHQESMPQYWCQPLVFLRRTQSYVGANLFSYWREQTEDEQRKMYDDLGFSEYTKVEPYDLSYLNFQDLFVASPDDLTAPF